MPVAWKVVPLILYVNPVLPVAVALIAPDGVVPQGTSLVVVAVTLIVTPVQVGEGLVSGKLAEAVEPALLLAGIV